MAKTPVGLLQELCVAQKWIPVYELTNAEGKPHSMTYEMTVLIQKLDMSATGTGKQKMAAKHNAAQSMLDLLKESHPGLFPNSTSQPQSPLSDDLGENCVGLLQNYCVDNYLTVFPEYKLVSESGEPHDKTFVYECHLEGLITLGTAKSKKLAKKMAANRMLKMFEERREEPMNVEGKRAVEELCGKVVSL